MVTRRRMLMVPPAATVAAIISSGARSAAARRQAPPPALEPVHRGPWMRAPYDTYVRNPLVARNTFLQMTPDMGTVPLFESARPLLPEPFWEGHAAAIDCSFKAWTLAFANLRRPQAASGFVARFIDPAFNDCVFMWDSCFMTLFGRYGARAFPFVRTLDNFYAKQHPDGFICREIGRAFGDDRFSRFDPSSTGPNVMAWAEWEHYRNFGDRDRLARVFPVLRAYHQWLRAYRTWPDGSYWSTGWGCGMDNQPRLPTGTPYADPEHYHGRMTWVDATLQQILSARLLVEMGRALGANEDVADMREETARLGRFVNAHLWSDADRFYCDRFDDGALNHVKSVGGYWALLAGVVPPARLAPFLAHLEDPRGFKRPHRVPSLSVDHPSYDPRGGYWKGSVWAPTTYMVLRGLTAVGRDALAHEIARNHLDNVVAVFRRTGTLAKTTRLNPPRPARRRSPTSSAGPGCRRSRCCWSTSSACARMLPPAACFWDVRLTEAHGVRRYPFGARRVDRSQLRRPARARRPAAHRGRRDCARRGRGAMGGGSRVMQCGN